MNIDNTGFFSYVFSSWMTKYLWKAYRKGIALSDLPPISPLDSCSCNAQKFENLWNEELRLRGPTSASLSLVAWRFVRFRVLISCILNVGSQIVNFTMQTVLLRHFLEFHENVEDNFFWGMHWVVYIVIFNLIQMILYTWGDIMNKRTALRLKSVCLSLLFKKVIHSNNINSDNKEKLIEMLTEDGHKIYDAVDSGASMIVGPIVALCVLICSSLWLNSLALFGLIFYLAFYVMQYWLVHLVNYCEQNVNEFTKERMQKTIEIMENIRLIKINGWEQHFIQNVSNIRNREEKWLWKRSYVKSLNSSTMDALPVIAIIIMFFLHGTVSYDLKPSITFPICVVMMVQIHGTFRSIKPSLSRLQESLKIFKKIKGGLLMEDTSCLATKPYEPTQAVAIVNGTFVYDIRKKQSHQENTEEIDKKQYINDHSVTDNEKQKLNLPTFEPKRVEILTSITLKAKKGQLIGICGRPSSGKSSLLLAALGQIKMTSGQLMRQGSCAYVGQKAWLDNATIKENILFEEVYDAKKYYEALLVCKLRHDMRTLPDGDETEIGDGGVEVTETFRQRISLARAFYADRDIYFLDDPLSSMEDRISGEIFEDLIIRALAEKTILLVTQELEYLDRCDYMYIMRDGKIAEHGRHKELMRLGKEYASMVKAAIDEDGYVDELLEETEEQHISERKQSVINIDFPVSKKTDDDVYEEEAKSEPQEIEAKNYYRYTKFLGNYFLIFSVITSYLIYSGMQVFSLWRLATWIQFTYRNSILLLTDKEYLFAYYHNWFGFCFVLVICGCIVQSLTAQYAAVKIGYNVHTELVNKLVHSSMKVFDFSSKRMTKLFSRDLHDISIQLPSKLDNTLRYAALGISTFFVLISTIPWFSNYVVFTSPVFYFLGNMYKIAYKNFNRLEHETRTRMNMFLENSMRGLSTIRTFKKETDLLSKFQNIVDNYSVCYFTKGVSERWLSVRLQLLSTVFIFVASTVIIILEKDISPAIAGLTFIYILTIPNVVQVGMRYFLKTESSFHSVQNIYSNTELLTDEVNDKITTVLPDLEWPTTGTIEFDKAVLKYNENDKDDIVLDSVSFSVSGGERIGVLNLSESGKNALILALYRLYELNSGRISIDKIDLSKIGIKLLRNRLSIVPQDPIFYGTIRFFLDPDKRHTDAELWNSLEKVHMKDRIAACASQLHYTIDGRTFNVIEKQLFYLAKAFLSLNKILLIEECDGPESLRGLIHQVIEKEFPDTTVVIITRRLRTVLSCDQVLVMDSNQVLEFNRPSILLTDPNSNLKKMMASMEEMRRRM